MSDMSGPLETLLRHPGLWRGEGRAQVALPSIPTGFPELDALLPGGGWPRGALTEILCEREGIGELRLLMPALARISPQNHWLAWVAPPHIPYAPALWSSGIDLSRVLMVRPRLQGDALWAVEQALRSGTCGAVLAWPAAGDERMMRRLQLAAEAGRCWGVLYRPAQAASQPSPAALRIHLAARGERLVVRILKRRGGGASMPLILDVNDVVAGVASSRSAAGDRAPGRALS